MTPNKNVSAFGASAGKAVSLAVYEEMRLVAQELGAATAVLKIELETAKASAASEAAKVVERDRVIADLTAQLSEMSDTRSGLTILQTKLQHELDQLQTNTQATIRELQNKLYAAQQKLALASTKEGVHAQVPQGESSGEEHFNANNLTSCAPRHLDVAVRAGGQMKTAIAGDDEDSARAQASQIHSSAGSEAEFVHQHILRNTPRQTHVMHTLPLYQALTRETHETASTRNLRALVEASRPHSGPTCMPCIGSIP